MNLGEKIKLCTRLLHFHRTRGSTRSPLTAIVNDLLSGFRPVPQPPDDLLIIRTRGPGQGSVVQPLPGHGGQRFLVVDDAPSAVDGLDGVGALQTALVDSV